MASVSFQAIDGVDKGRSYENMETPVTVGREEGNVIRLNDDRVSRFHAKIQEDHGQIVLTDLDSTNGTCVNGEPVQLRLLRAGDQVVMGRSKLVFGTAAEIAAALKENDGSANATIPPNAATIMNGDVANMTAMRLDPSESRLELFERSQPKLPERLSPAQAAQLSEVIDFLHRALGNSLDNIHIPPNSVEARLPIASWLKVQSVLSILARYSRQVAEPEQSAEKSQA